ncbi:acyl carrier protein [Pseudomonas sp. SDI]|uniref:acyl carrier protein n=1 Tax=Pseudomonas sp. SDI TaxID=2170734 RepID=UPI000DE73937|nr:acyl carrier protein [Pseudomonas sp. SDI]PWB33114.1 acyl carrier protein [Pseudomonas sp. SDI]
MSNEAIQAQLASIIEDVIQTSVGADDLLIESGLIDSLTAVDVVLAVKRTFGCRFPATEIDEHLESLNTLTAYVAAHRTL